MPNGVASSNQLAIMNKVLSAYCRAYSITDSADREDAATIILRLFDSGFRDEETLLAEMIKRRA